MKFSILNMFSFVTIFALSIALGTVMLSRDPVITINSNNELFSWSFRQKVMKASPTWPEQEINPPISARGAIKIADEICERLNHESKKIGANSWGFEQISLFHLNAGFRDIRTKNSRTKWCYLVVFTPYRSSVNQIETAAFIILMDGKVLTAESPWSNTELQKRMQEIYGPSG